MSRPVALAAFVTALTIAACDSPAPVEPTTANDAVGVTDHYSTAAAATLTRAAPGVLANDGVDNATVRVARNPRLGVVELAPDGSFSYTPKYRFRGQDSFSYEIVSGENISAPVEVTITFPNVIVILVDDLGLGDLAGYNEAAITDTPNLDALAAEGVRFTHAHSSAAVCSPSRYSVLTGNMPHRGRLASGIWDTNVRGTMFLAGQQTLGNIFSDAGYRTGFVGKTHTGALFSRSDGSITTVHKEIDFTLPFAGGPTELGFDYSFVLPVGLSGSPYAYFEDDRLVRFDDVSGTFKPFTDVLAALNSFVYRGKAWGADHNGGRIGSPGYVMDNYDSREVGAIMTGQALNFLSAAIDANEASDQSEPFFLLFAPPQLHRPHTPPDTFTTAGGETVAVANTSGISGRTDVIREIDLMVGELITLLDIRGQLDNTVIVFTSDNGAVWSEAEGASLPQGTENGVQLRGAKGDIYEGGHRVPLIVRWGKTGDGPVAAAASSNQLTGLHDLAATFYALTGQQRPEAQANDSKSLLPALIDGKTGPLRDHLIVQGSPKTAADNFNYINRAYYSRDSGGNVWKLSIISSDTDPFAELRWLELFNLSNDPGESQNLIATAAHAVRLEQMQAEYLDLMARPRTIDGFR